MFSGKEKVKIINKLMPLNRYGLLIRLVNEEDAEFIFNLRTDPSLARFIHKISHEIKDQIKWIKEYKIREAHGMEFYFISIDPVNNEKQGVNRIYNFAGNTFELGSWIYSKKCDFTKSILGDIIVREIAFDYLQFDICVFEVRKQNKTVINYHKRYHPEQIGENDLNVYFKLTKETFNKEKNIFLNLLGYGDNK
ncbi:MAG: GNAT family N-acetyltransferase [Bacteroidales bacterium]